MPLSRTRHGILSVAILSALTAPTATAGEVTAPPQAETSASLISSSRVQLGADSHIGRVTRVAIPLAGDATTQAYQFMLRTGSIEVDVGDAQSQDFDVKLIGERLVELPSRGSPPAAVLVRSSQGQVAVVARGKATIRVDNGFMTVINRQGRTLVGTVKAVRPLAAGYAKSFSCSEGNADRVVPTAPEVATGKRLWMTNAAGSIRPSGLSWSPSPGAAKYEVEFRNDETGAEVAKLAVDQTQIGATAPELFPGRYHVSIRPVDACGIAGQVSKSERLHVVGVALPPGAHIDEDGTVRVRVRQPIILTHANGVLTRFGPGGAWVPLSPEFRLYSPNEVSLALRIDGIRDEEVLRVAPLRVSASVEIKSPSQQANGTLQVTIRQQTPDRGDAPRDLVLSPRVTVGVDPVYVRWTKADGVMHAIIPPQPGNGPWVVRVEVTDQYGNMLGRNFLEVSPHDG